MQIKFRRAIYQEYELEIPLQDLELKYQGNEEEAILNNLHKSYKVDEEVEIRDIHRGSLDDNDINWQYFEMVERNALYEAELDAYNEAIRI
ncbi:hypothetical protein [Anaerococcus cruorum]|uniref:Uncharacterized protein n=1 Tax=Anaerococcus cruorum TaxID=3115617 RepID=A0ABW9MWB0_9FIRM